MNAVAATATNTQQAAVQAAAGQRELSRLRQTVDQMVGAIFINPVLKMARENPFKGELGHGGRGEEMFKAQLDMELALRAGKKMRSSLNQAIFDRYARYVRESAGDDEVRGG